MASLESRRLVDQLLRGDIQQLVLGGAVQHPLLADLQQHRHGERRDAVEPSIFDAAPGAAPVKIPAFCAGDRYFPQFAFTEVFPLPNRS